MYAPHRDVPLSWIGTLQGWDQGIAGMCVGEKRKLKIPPGLGYGDRGAGASIPGTRAEGADILSSHPDLALESHMSRQLWQSSFRYDMI